MFQTSANIRRSSSLPLLLARACLLACPVERVGDLGHHQGEFEVVVLDCARHRSRQGLAEVLYDAVEALPQVSWSRAIASRPQLVGEHHVVQAALPLNAERGDARRSS